MDASQDMTRRAALGGAIGLAGAVALGAPAILRAQTKLIPVTLAIQFFARGDYSQYYLTRERGYYAERGLDVTIKHVLGNALAFQTLSAGNADFVHADLGQMLQLQGRSPEPRMRSVAIVGDTLALSLFFMKGHGIDKPSDMQGHSIVDSPGSNAPAIFRMFAKANGFDPAKTTWKNAAATAKVAMMVQNQADAVAIYLPAKPGIEAKLPPGQQLGVFTFGDYGVNIYGDGLITTEAFWTGKQDVTRAFVQASMKGCKDAFAHPGDSVDAMIKFFPEIDRDIAIKELQIMAGIAVGPTQREHGLGFHDAAKFAATRDAVINLLDQPIARPAGDFFTNAALA